MKSLSQYIKDREFEEHIVKVKIPYSQFSTFNEFLDINDKTIENVTEKEIDQFDRLVFSALYERNKQYLWFIDEMLNSNSAKNLFGVLKEVFGDYVIDYEISKDDKRFANGACMLDIYVKDGVVDDTTEFSNENDKYHKYFSPKLKLKEFESIIQSHQYFITLVCKVGDYFCISCEPKFTEKVNTPGDKYGYHVIYTGKKKDGSFGSENLKKILKVGLRPQVGVLPNGDALVSKERLNMEYRYDTGVRYFPERIYFFLDNDNLYKELKDFINAQKGWRFGEYVIIKFKIGNTIAFKNPASIDDNNVFTYDGIPREDLKEFLTDYRDFANYKEGDDTSEFSHKKLN